MKTSEEYYKLCCQMIQELEKKDKKILELEALVLDLQKFFDKYPAPKVS